MFLNCHTYFSFKYGTLSIEALLEEAQRHGVKRLVLTDINNTSGCLDFIRLAPKYGVAPVVGIDFRRGVQQCFVGIAKNNEGFFELNRFLSECIANGETPEKAPRFNNCYIVYPFGTIDPCLLLENEYLGVRASFLNQLRFSDQRFFEHKMVVLYPVTFQNKTDFNTHRLLRAIDNNTLLSKLPVSEQTVPDEIMMSEQVLSAIFQEYPLMVKNTYALISNCSIAFEFGKSKNKKLFTGTMEGDLQLLRSKCYEGLQYRYSQPDKKVFERVEKELTMIFEMGFCSYFLINWDLVNYALQRNFFYVGRGSGANSIVAYCLRITDVDPIDLDLYFERFINTARVNPPDFDIDFSWKDRDEIIAYVFRRYGVEHTCLLATYSTFQRNSVIRELGKVFGLPPGEIDELSGGKASDHIGDLVLRYSKRIHDFPNHLSIHAGGILISEKPIHYYTATSMPPKGFPLSQFSMLEAEDLGLYKFDILSQRGLGHIKDAVETVKKNKGVEIDIHQVHAFKNDEKIKELLRIGKTTGCFYVESPAMRMLLRKLETDTYIGLVAASSIIRPGVARSGMMREYILRHRDVSKRTYLHPLMEELMHETYGIMVYQEDVIKVAHYFAGLTLTQADVLRRGMSGKFRGREEFAKARDDFFSNCRAKGYQDTLTHEVWRQIESFANYSFSKGHSASYAVESYQSLYLKAYYPLEFMVGVINNFGGFYYTEIYVHEARMAGADIQAPCVNKSEYVTGITGKSLFLGFIHMKELEQKAVEQLISERQKNGTFKSLDDFMKRVSISIEQLRILIRIGAFRSTGKGKKELLWEIYSILGKEKKTKPVKELFEVPNTNYTLPELHYHNFDDALDEIEILGFPLCSPFSLLKEPVEKELNMKDLIQHLGKELSITGYLVHYKTTYTIKGEPMVFGTFLDSEGHYFDTTHFPRELRQYPFRGKGCYLIKGRVVEEFQFPSIEVKSMVKLEILSRN